MTNEIALSAPTLYDRLGGEPALRKAVELFYERVLADPQLSPFFTDIAMNRLQSHQYAFLSQACGGPRQYQGESMAKAHAHLSIEQKHFDAVAGHLVETLRSLGVSEEMIEEVVGKVAPLAPQIVTSSSADA